MRFNERSADRGWRTCVPGSYCRLIFPTRSQHSSDWSNGRESVLLLGARRSRCESSKEPIWRWSGLRRHSMSGHKRLIRSKPTRMRTIDGWLIGGYGPRTSRLHASGSLLTICSKSPMGSSKLTQRMRWIRSNLKCSKGWPTTNAVRCMNWSPIYCFTLLPVARKTLFTRLDIWSVVWTRILDRVIFSATRLN